jgi:sphingomyelin phosphodiesterase acid-like 3
VCKLSWVKKVLVLALFFAIAACAQAAQNHAPRTLPVIMLSDIHFDPFHDPSKFKQLQSAPVTDWAKVLDAPDSPTRERDFASLQKTCQAHTNDTDWALFASSLKAERTQQPAPLFVTVSGDLMAHQFDCRFNTLAPGARPSAYTAFAEKTVAFVALELRLAFPNSPVYLALGNNDSGCGDYRETPDSKFLREVAKSLAEDADKRNRAEILHEFPHQGSFDISLPKPMERTQLIVLQDIFQSYRYQTCSGTDDRTAMKTQLTWLAKHLAEARDRREHVWIMAHIPPGVNVYTTFMDRRDICADQPPSMFLSSESMADTLVKYADVVRFVVLAHTHNDEIRLLDAGVDQHDRDGHDAIPAKLIPSISPVHGNAPAFLVATVDPVSSIIADYSVFAANNQTGIATQWQREYSYSEAYGQPDFSAASVEHVVNGFVDDRTGTSAASRNYQRWYSVGDSEVRGSVLQRIWPAYVCSIFENHEADFRKCICSGNAVHP